MTATDRLIWSNYDIDEEWVAELKEEYPKMSEDEMDRMICDIYIENLDAERCNLDIQLSRPILLISDIGKWDGRHNGYAEIKSGNIRDCLYSNMDYNTWYVDKYGDLRCDAVHHDGKNHYLYRVYKDGISDEQIENLQWKILRGKATRADITRLTNRLGDEIGKVYGWDFPGRKTREAVGAR